MDAYIIRLQKSPQTSLNGTASLVILKMWFLKAYLEDSSKEKKKYKKKHVINAYAWRNDYAQMCICLANAICC